MLESNKESPLKIFRLHSLLERAQTRHTTRPPTILPEYYVGEERRYAQLIGRSGERKHTVIVGCNEEDIKRIFSRYTRSHPELTVLSGHLRKAWTHQRTHSHEWVFLVETNQSYPSHGIPWSCVSREEKRLVVLRMAREEMRDFFEKNGKPLPKRDTQVYRQYH